MIYYSENLSIGDKRFCKCAVCLVTTEQTVQEYTVEYLPNDSANPKIGKYFSTIELGWFCNDCSDCVEEIIIGKF